MEQEIKAKLKYLRIAPRKTRYVADIIRGLPVDEAKAQLMFSKRRASDSILKLLNSAVANAKHNDKVEIPQLYVKEIKVDQGPKFKRWIPRARGSSNIIEKKTSHVTLVLGVNKEAKLPRFVFEEKKKKEKSISPKKTGGKKEKVSEFKEEKTALKPKKSKGSGLFRRVFRRKSV